MLVGFWSEQTTLHSNEFQIYDEKVLHYLKAKYRKLVFVESYEFGYSYCRLGCSVDDGTLAHAMEMGALTFTDGVFIWPEGYVHYVEKHNWRLPLAFENHIKGLELEKMDMGGELTLVGGEKIPGEVKKWICAYTKVDIVL